MSSSSPPPYGHSQEELHPASPVLPGALLHMPMPHFRSLPPAHCPRQSNTPCKLLFIRYLVVLSRCLSPPLIRYLFVLSRCLSPPSPSSPPGIVPGTQANGAPCSVLVLLTKPQSPGRTSQRRLLQLGVAPHHQSRQTGRRHQSPVARIMVAEGYSRASLRARSLGCV